MFIGYIRNLIAKYQKHEIEKPMSEDRVWERKLYISTHARERMGQYKLSELEVREAFDSAVRINLPHRAANRSFLKYGARVKWTRRFESENLVLIVSQQGGNLNDYSLLTVYPKVQRQPENGTFRRRKKISR